MRPEQLADPRDLMPLQGGIGIGEKACRCEAGGIRVDDVPGVNGTEVAEEFISQVQKFGEDESGNKKLTERNCEWT